MEINQRNIKKWSAIGARPTFGLTMLEIAEKKDNLMVLTADVSTSAGLERFRRQYPEKYLDVGIAEQNMMGIATGLAKEGFCVYTTTFAPFQSMRCFEQIRVNQGYMNIPLKMVGLASGLYHSYLGNTHCCIEDCAILRTIPNLAIITPADGSEVVKAVEAAAEYEQSVYIRLMGGSGLPIVYTEDYKFEIGVANVVKEGNDVAILASGTMVHQSMLVAEYLEQKNISCKVVDFHTIKPIDKEMLDSLENYKLIVTIEEHSVVGGLGSAVAEYMAQKKEKPRHILLGVDDFYPHAGEYETALEQCGLTVELIENTIEKALGE